MRSALALAACLMIATWVNAEDTGQAAKQPPAADAVLSLCGARLAKVFDRVGVPEDVEASGDDDGGVDLDYGAFGFKIKDKTATACFFWKDWKEPVKGVKFGNTKDQVIKILGATKRVFKHKDGLEDYGWDLKEPDAVLWVFFDKDDNVKEIDAESK